MVKEDTPSVDFEASRVVDETDAREVEGDALMSQSTEELPVPEGSILKTILVRGNGPESPGLGASVIINYVGSHRSTDGVSSVDSKQEGFCFTLGSSSEGVSALWNRALMTMKKKEKSKFIFREKKKQLNEEAIKNKVSKEKKEEEVEYEIELVSWTNSQNVTADGGVSKVVLQEGSGAETPGSLSLCFVSYFLKTPDGTCVVGDEDVSKVDTATLGLFSVDTIEGIAEVLKSMKKGERARVRLARMYSRKDKVLEGEIELLDFQESPDVSTMSVEAKLDYGNQLKDIGNNLLKNDLLRRARNFYEEGANVFQNIEKLKEKEDEDQSKEMSSGDKESEGDEGKVEGNNKDTESDGKKKDSESQRIFQLYIQCKLNLALCALKQADYLMAITVCSEVIALDDHNVKALFRRAQAYSFLKEHGEALRDLSHIVRQEGKTSAVVAKLIKEVKQARERERKAQARTFGGMFEKLHLLSDDDTSPRVQSPLTPPQPTENHQDSVRRLLVVLFSILVVVFAVVVGGLIGLFDFSRLAKHSASS